MTKILLVDDHPAVGEGTKAMIEQHEDMEVDVVLASIDVPKLVQQTDYDLFIFDLYMPELNGLELSKQVLQLNPDAKIIIYTGFDLSSHIQLLMEAGVGGFVSKTATREQLITVIKCTLRDEVVLPLHLFRQLKKVESKPAVHSESKVLRDVTLNERDQLILLEIANGLTNKDIATKLTMSQRTVEYALTGIFQKLGCRSRTEALLKSKQLGILPEQYLT